MIFVDTGYLLAVLNLCDELFERAQRWATAVREPLVTKEYVVWELVNALSAPVDRKKAHSAVAEIRTSASWQLIHAAHELFSAGLALHEQRADKHWSLTDCVSFVVMQQRGLRQALAFDHHFEQAGFEAVAPSRSTVANWILDEAMKSTTESELREREADNR
jgi:predicted nucleic acid-binding protein